MSECYIPSTQFADDEQSSDLNSFKSPQTLSHSQVNQNLIHLASHS